MPSPRKQIWQNPKDVMKTHRIKRQSSVSKRKTTKKSTGKSGPLEKANSSHKALSVDEENAQKLQTASVSLKRKNPFLCEKTPPHENGSKRRLSILDSDIPLSKSTDSQTQKTESVDNDNETNPSVINRSPSRPSKLIGILRKAEHMSHDTPSLSQSNHPSMAKNKSLSTTNSPQPRHQYGNSGADETLEQTITRSTSENNFMADKYIPVDYSIKTKLRVVVESNEEAFKRTPGIDAKNVINFVHHTLENGKDWKDLNIFQRLRRCCLHYSYPQFPWMRKFPRASGEFRSKPMPFLSNNDEVLRDIRTDWSNVFTSLYQQLRGGFCPYFYVCTHQFTVLFRCQRFSSKEASMSALLSPSTRGFRELLSKEDIEFRLPNIDMHKVEVGNKPECPNESQTSSLQVTSQSTDHEADVIDTTEANEEQRCEDEEEEEDDINDHHGASKWLEGMGLNKKDFPSLEPLKVKLQRDGYREIDNRPQSMVYIEGGDVHTFFNFLLNYPACIASSGVQHGIPPTLLSPVPFVGGSLVQNTVKHSQLRDVPVKVPGFKDLMYSHVFEISGPILPHHSLNIAALLQDYHQHQEGSSVITFNTHLPSAAFNSQAVNQPEKDQLAVNLHKLFVDFELGNPGLLSPARETLNKSPVLASGTFLKELRITSDGYSWS